MPATTSPNRQPNYCRQRRCDAPDRAYVTIKGRRYYLGRYGTAESMQRYQAILAEYEAEGTPPRDPRKRVTINRVCIEYLAYLKRTYAQPDGTLSNQGKKIKSAITVARELYGKTDADAFRARQYRACRQKLIDCGNARSTINEAMRLIRGMFRWAKHEDLIEPATYDRIADIPGIRRGQLDVAEGRKVKPAPRSDVRRVRRRLVRPVRALADLQLLTGARAGELVKLRAIDLDTSGNVWTYTPEVHKTAHHDHVRTIYFGRKAQRILSLFMRPERPVDAPLFSPREGAAEAKRREAEGSRRPDQKPTPTISSRRIGEHYTTASYRRSIRRACEAAGVTPWHPHQLRHATATRLRREYGIETARIMLGHSGVDATAIYAEADHEKAIQVARMIG